MASSLPSRRMISPGAMDKPGTTILSGVSQAEKDKCDFFKELSLCHDTVGNNWVKLGHQL